MADSSMTNDAVSIAADELARLRECEARCAWLLPLITGAEDENTEAKTLALAQALLLGMDGNDAIDAARKAVP